MISWWHEGSPSQTVLHVLYRYIFAAMAGAVVGIIMGTLNRKVKLPFWFFVVAAFVLGILIMLE